jgi:hypothetical protein
MRDLLILVAHLLRTVARLLGPGGAKAVVAESLLMKHQLLVINRSRHRAPNFSTLDRILLGFWSLFLAPRPISRAAVIHAGIDAAEISRGPKEAQVSAALLIAQEG